MATPGGVWAFRIGTYEPNPSLGWTYSFRMKGLKDLLASMQEAHLQNSVTKLAIVAHGDSSGLVQLDRDLTMNTIDSFKNELSDLATYLTGGGKLMFVSCLAGAGREGAVLLMSISRYLPKRDVIGFVVTGVKPQEGLKAVAGQMPVGLGFASGATPARTLKGTPDLNEDSMYAKWARDGVIVRVSDSWDLADMLRGSWQISLATDDGQPSKSYKDAKVELSPVQYKKEIFITKDGKKLLTGTYDTDIIGKTPKVMDIKYSSGPNSGKISQGIFRFEPVAGTDLETLAICLAQPSKARPIDFTAGRKSGRLLMSLKYSKSQSH